jgi:hypothetical protein
MAPAHAVSALCVASIRRGPVFVQYREHRLSSNSGDPSSLAGLKQRRRIAMSGANRGSASSAYAQADYLFPAEGVIDDKLLLG